MRTKINTRRRRGISGSCDGGACFGWHWCGNHLGFSILNRTARTQFKPSGHPVLVLYDIRTSKTSTLPSGEPHKTTQLDQQISHQPKTHMHNLSQLSKECFQDKEGRTIKPKTTGTSPKPKTQASNLRPKAVNLTTLKGMLTNQVAVGCFLAVLKQSPNL